MIRRLETKIINNSQGLISRNDFGLMEEVRQRGKAQKTEAISLCDAYGRRIWEIATQEKRDSISYNVPDAWNVYLQKKLGYDLGRAVHFVGHKFAGLLHKDNDWGGCLLCGKEVVGRDLSIRALSLDASNIHSHPLKLPLSVGDVDTAFQDGFKRIIAVSPDGSFSCMGFPSRLRAFFDKPKILDSIFDFAQISMKNLIHYKISNETDARNASPSTIKSLAKDQEIALRKLAKIAGFKYYSNGF